MQYKTVIEGVLIPYIASLNNNKGPYTFMHDSAPCHPARSINNVFGINNVPLLPWSSNSPDINSIENVWGTLKRRYCLNKK